MCIPFPQSSSHDDGLTGGDQDLWTMSQRTADGDRSQKMFFDGVWKNTSSTSVTMIGAAAEDAGAPSPACAGGNEDEGVPPPPLEQAATAKLSSATRGIPRFSAMVRRVYGQPATAWELDSTRPSDDGHRDGYPPDARGAPGRHARRGRRVRPAPVAGRQPVR